MIASLLTFKRQMKELKYKGEYRLLYFSYCVQVSLVLQQLETELICLTKVVAEQKEQLLELREKAKNMPSEKEVKSFSSIAPRCDLVTLIIYEFYFRQQI